MTFYSVWPAIVCLGVVTLLAWTPLFRRADSPATDHRGRILSMDGLRGFLALAVVLHHVAIYQPFLGAGLRSESWAAPSSGFYAAIGPMGVSMFFMITGYLFWSRLLSERGRPAWITLYIGRIFRIGPLYLAVVGVATVLDGFSRIPAPLESHAKVVASWALLGLSVYPDWHRFLAGVTWSLQYEWLYYLMLPLLWVFVARRWFHLATAVTALLAILAFVQIRDAVAADAPLGSRLIRTAFFLAGMVSASLHRRGLRVRLPDWLASALAASALLAVFCFQDVISPGPVLLLGFAFFLISSGTTMWGLLTSRPAIRLGDISYSIYLVQGLVLAACFRPPALQRFGLSAPWHAWCLTLLAMVTLVLVALATYELIEKPGIALGRHVARAAVVRPPVG